MATRYVLLVMLTACGGDDQPAQLDAPAQIDGTATQVVYVVRHAETGSTATDPSLDATGQARARALATRLAGAGIATAYARQYKRTQETAMPAAATAGITVTVMPVTTTNVATYGTELANAVKTSGTSAALIVGHSNTVPATVKALTNITINPITETEYDRIYTITLASDGPHLDEARY
jgi:phosphohistidine phosphatase SixA